MKTNELQNLSGFEAAVDGTPEDIESVYCADLLSWAMGRAPAGSAWCTVMGNVNAIAVAALADVAVVVLCEGAALDEEACEKAVQRDINVVKTKLPAFQAGMVIAKSADLYRDLI